MKRRNRFVLGVLLSSIIALMFQHGSQTHAQTDTLSGRTITGTAFFVGGATSARAANAPRSSPFTLIITRLTTPDEINQLNSVLQSGGQDQMLRTLSSMKAGLIRIGTGVGIPANAIMATKEGEQTRVTVLYEREVRLSELRFGARSSDFRYGYAEMYLGAGANQGMLIYAARVRLRDGNTWDVEDFGTFPARLMGLQIRGGPREEVR